MKQLSNTISRLKSDPLNAVTVTDKDTLIKVVTDATGAALEESYGSVEGFFEWMHGQGINRLLIRDRRKNGSGFKAVGEYHADLMDRNGSDPIQSAATTQPQQSPVMHKAVPMQDMFGFGMNGMAGLNMVDVAYKMQDHSRLFQENQELKVKVGVLEAENKKLEKEVLTNELVGTKTVEKTKANNELAQTFAPLLSLVAQKFLTPQEAIATAGLSGANATPMQQYFIGLAQNADENFLNDLALLIKGMAEKPDFDAELNELMIKHNLTTV